ncbi:hypothetical protein [Frankia sp. CiP1_Cm_nod2]|uniref:hypothetical protein n=1 Tax=Frankia sp. CiP1_Cm_nod2 TaxID=2897161 RepID=UPI00202425E2
MAVSFLIISPFSLFFFHFIVLFCRPLWANKPLAKRRHARLARFETSHPRPASNRSPGRSPTVLGDHGRVEGGPLSIGDRREAGRAGRPPAASSRAFGNLDFEVSMFKVILEP